MPRRLGTACVILCLSGLATSQAPLQWRPLTHRLAPIAAAWDSTRQATTLLSNEGGLQILVEKDWKCTNPTDPKDNEDCFENPDPQCT